MEVNLRISLLALAFLLGCSDSDVAEQSLVRALPDNICFERHVIDGTGSGADGVHLGDINRDGYPDVVSGWEESSDLKVYFHPGESILKLKEPWASVDVRGGQGVPNIEDAAFADMDGDGQLDAVISATEGEENSDANRRVRIHQWDTEKAITDPASWAGSVVYKDEPTDRFMKVRAAQLDGKHGADIVALSRDLFDNTKDSDTPSKSGAVYLFSAPPPSQVTNPSSWTRTELATVHKGKSIELIDMDQDDDIDILYAGTSTIAWLQNPGPNADARNWVNQPIGSASDLAICDINGDGVRDIVATAGRKEFPVVAKWFEGIRSGDDSKLSWQQHNISIDRRLPTKFYQLENFALKSIACGNFLPNAKPGDPADIIITTSGSGYGIFLVVAPTAFPQDVKAPWSAVPLTEYKWITKYDNIMTVDMDFDGDTDFVTSEENEGLLFQGAGVLWYENKSCE